MIRLFFYSACIISGILIGQLLAPVVAGAFYSIEDDGMYDAYNDYQLSASSSYAHIERIATNANQYTILPFYNRQQLVSGDYVEVDFAWSKSACANQTKQVFFTEGYSHFFFRYNLPTGVSTGATTQSFTAAANFYLGEFVVLYTNCSIGDWVEIREVRINGESIPLFAEYGTGTTTEFMSTTTQAQLLLTNQTIAVLLFVLLSVVITIGLIAALGKIYKKKKYLQYSGGDVEIREDL